MIGFVIEEEVLRAIAELRMVHRTLVDEETDALLNSLVASILANIIKRLERGLRR